MSMVVAEGELLLVRVWSWKPAVLVRDATRHYLEAKADGRHDAVYGISTFGLRREPEEPMNNLKRRTVLLAKSYLKVKYVAFTSQDALMAAGFPVTKDEPPRDHYLVTMEPPPESTAGSLSAVFDQHPRERVDA